MLLLLLLLLQRLSRPLLGLQRRQLGVRHIRRDLPEQRERVVLGAVGHGPQLQCSGDACHRRLGLPRPPRPPQLRHGDVLVVRRHQQRGRELGHQRVGIDAGGGAGNGRLITPRGSHARRVACHCRLQRPGRCCCGSTLGGCGGAVGEEAAGGALEAGRVAAPREAPGGCVVGPSRGSGVGACCGGSGRRGGVVAVCNRRCGRAGGGTSELYVARGLVLPLLLHIPEHTHNTHARQRS